MLGPFNEKEVFANLLNLEILELGGNMFESTIPTEITSLPKLANFYIGDSFVTGDLSFIKSMPAIFELWIDSNKGLVGSIPSEIGSVSTLASFSVASCSLTGAIPSELGQLTEMQRLWLQSNFLNGTVPTELGRLDSMDTFNIAGNQITGIMPTDLCENKMTTFGADCPIEISCTCCTCCGSICVDGVHLSGADDDMAGLAVEDVIDDIAFYGGAEFKDPASPQSKARFWIIADSGVSQLQRDFSKTKKSSVIQRYSLAVLYFATNSVINSFNKNDSVIPKWNRTDGWLSSSDECAWYGVRCTPEGLVESLDLSSNALTGGIPMEIVYLSSSLAYLDISGNEVANEDEELMWMGQLTKLTYLDVHFCNFAYNGVPVYLAKLVNLEVLDISYCLFFGKIDGALFVEMNNLYYLDIGGNSYHTSVPKEIAVLPELKYFYADNTEVTGDLSFIDHMNAIAELWLDFNPKLGGTIPTSIGNITSLQSFSITNCGLTGTIPLEMGNLSALTQVFLNNNLLSGTVPKELGSLNNLITLHLEGNGFNGTMSEEVCSLRVTNLKELGADCSVPFPSMNCSCCTCCGSPCTESNGTLPGLQAVLEDSGIEIADDGYSLKSFKWIMLNKAIQSYSAARIVQRFVLACIFFATDSVENEFTIATYGPKSPIPGWTNKSGWLTDDSECSWYGVSCDSSGYVNAIRLSNNSLSGIFPKEISSLGQYLKVLDISGNVVGGSNKQLDWIGSLTELIELDVHSCNLAFNGVPDKLGKLTNLEFLDISYSLFYGPLNGSIFAGMHSLAHLDIGGNSFNSSIPNEIFSLRNLTFLYAEFTDLTGDLSSIGEMSKIAEIWVDFNPAITGSIPSSIAKATTLQSLSAASCGLTGKIPSEIGFLTDMQQLWLYNNSLTGTIPYSISNLAELRHFHVEGNNLIGQMPVGLCVLRDAFLESLAADCEIPDPKVECVCCTCCGVSCWVDDGHGAATSVLEDAGIDYSGRFQSQAATWLLSTNALANYSSARILQRYALVCVYLATYGVVTPYSDSDMLKWVNSDRWLSSSDECSWFGLKCNEHGFVKFIDLSNNNVTGSIPMEVVWLGKSLEHLDLSGNAIYNEADDLAWISGLTKLTYLDVSWNGFMYDGIPSVFPPSLESLDISYTLFQGALTGSTFERLSNLTYLDMGGNSYHSALPSELVKLPNLMYLYAQDADLTGDLAFVSSMVSLSELWLDSNPGIGGSLPASVADATQLVSISLTSCSLTGSIPSELGLLTNMQQLWLSNNSLVGSIPAELANMTDIRVFDIQDNNLLVGSVSTEMCELRDYNGGYLESLIADCQEPNASVVCDCCTCCGSLCYGDYKGVDLKSILATQGIQFDQDYQRLAYDWLSKDPPLQAYQDRKVVQRFSLACLYFATHKVRTSYIDEGSDVPGWKESVGWLTAADECDWFGIKCEEGIVAVINLPSNGLTGSMPPEITLLHEGLSYLTIGGNPIASEMDDLSWIGQLTNLTHLDVHGCNFVYDGIPSFIAKLTKLVYLDISYTLFYGTINTTTFEPLVLLNYLDMGGNSYESPVPASIFSLPSLRYLYIQNADIYGNLSVLDNAVALKEVWLDDNHGINGTIPASIGNMKTLVSLSLSSCNLTGTIPSTLTTLTGMETLWLSNNSLTGSIPSEFSKFSSLRTFHLDGNELSGEIPSAMCALRDTFGGTITSLTSDCIADPIAKVDCVCCTCCETFCFSSSRDSETVTIALLDAGVPVLSKDSHTDVYAQRATQWLESQSDLLQTYPSSVPRIAQRYALACVYFATYGIATVYTTAAFASATSSSNTTMAPPSLPGWDVRTGWMSNTDVCDWFGISCNPAGLVTRIDLPSNGLTGNLPKEMQLLSDVLEYIDISGNIVASTSDELSWLASMTNLKHLDIGYCNFEYDGGIPPYVANLVRLEYLNVGHTQFAGSLNGTIFASLTNLKHLEIGSNPYRSSFPMEIASLPNLEYLYVDNTFLSGNITNIIDALSPHMIEFWADSSPDLIGALPSSIGKLTTLASLSLTSCGVEGSIPTELGLLTNMQLLWLSNNTLTGTLPIEIVNLTQLQIFQTEDNQLSGIMPQGLCDMRDVFGGGLTALSTDCALSMVFGPAQELIPGQVECGCCTCCEIGRAHV